MNWTHWIALGATLALVGIGLGAFGTHALKTRLSPDDLAIFEVGVRYQMYHAFALIAVGLIAVRIDNAAVTISGFAFLLGTLLFSGSLYGLVFSGIRTLGMVTPIGGAGFMIGWTALIWGTLRPL